VRTIATSSPVSVSPCRHIGSIASRIYPIEARRFSGECPNYRRRADARRGGKSRLTSRQCALGTPGLSTADAGRCASARQTRPATQPGQRKSQ
jgi:hypothetical protein